MTASDYVSRDTLAAHIKGIDEHFDHVEEDIAEMRREMNHGFASIRDAQWLGPQGRSFLSVGGFVSALCAVLIAIFLH